MICLKNRQNEKSPYSKYGLLKPTLQIVNQKSLYIVLDIFFNLILKRKCWNMCCLLGIIFLSECSFQYPSNIQKEE